MTLNDSLRRAAAAHGTPVYVTDLAALDSAAQAVREAFPDPWIRQYSVKANDVPEIVAEVAARGFGANVVSLGEWAVARKAGLSNERITLEGIGKTDADLRATVRAAADDDPLLWLALESRDEAEALTAMATREPGWDATVDRRSTSSSGSTRRSRPKRSIRWRSVRACPSSA